MASQGDARLGVVWLGSRGPVMHGMARLGSARQAWLGDARFGLARCGEACPGSQGAVPLGSARWGAVRCGMSRHGSHGSARLGGVRRGSACHGRVRQPRQGWARLGVARQRMAGVAGLGSAQAWCGTVRQCRAGNARPGWASRGASRHGTARRVKAVTATHAPHLHLWTHGSQRATLQGCTTSPSAPSTPGPRKTVGGALTHGRSDTTGPTPKAAMNDATHMHLTWLTSAQIMIPYSNHNCHSSRISKPGAAFAMSQGR